jgi:hypothetical protein
MKAIKTEFMPTVSIEFGYIVEASKRRGGGDPNNPLYLSDLPPVGLSHDLQQARWFPTEIEARTAGHWQHGTPKSAKKLNGTIQVSHF